MNCGQYGQSMGMGMGIQGKGSESCWGDNEEKMLEPYVSIFQSALDR